MKEVVVNFLESIKKKYNLVSKNFVILGVTTCIVIMILNINSSVESIEKFEEKPDYQIFKGLYT